MNTSPHQPNAHAYLVDVDDGREKETARRLLQLGPLLAPVFDPLGVHHEAFWCILEFDCKRLGIGIETDIDILMGQLAWADETVPYLISTVAGHSYPGYWEHRFAGEGRLRWPPPTQHLAGVETKVACLSLATPTTADRMRSSHAGPGKQRELAGKLNAYLDLALNRVLLLDVLVGPPSATSDPFSAAWLSALGMAAHARSLMDVALQNRRLPAPVGHAVWAIGAVEGGLEHARGAGGPEMLRMPKENPTLAADKRPPAREALDRWLNEGLASVDLPRTFPIVLVDCRRCRCLHHFGEGCRGVNARME